MLLLSVAVVHHHHLSEICVAVEQCAIDGNINDSHTAHHDAKDDGCVVQQMHTFVTNGKHISSVRHSLMPVIPASALFSDNSSPLYIYGDLRLTATAGMPVAEGFTSVTSLRGPPVL